MPNPLLNIFNNSNYRVANSTPAILGGSAGGGFGGGGGGSWGSPTETDTETLPHGGGTFNPSSDAPIQPAPITTPVFSGASSAPVAPVEEKTSQSSIYDKYRDPKTGEVMSPEEYAIYLGNKVPKGNGDIPNYAGDAMTKPNESLNDLTSRARDLANARNDIATGTTDPYKVGAKSGIAYSPQELKAIESAYAGIYDPALNDVFSRMSDQQKIEAKKTAREDKIFSTNESIRQWRATTGTKASGTGDSEKSLFTQSQLNDGASNAGLGIESFTSLDDDIKNFYINTPMALNDEEKKVPIYKNFEADFDRVLEGDLTAAQLTEDIMGSTLTPSVKTYFIDQIPEDPEKKQGYFSKVWGALTGN